MFAFDERVVPVFSDMLERSIPGYRALLELIAALAAEYVPEGGRVYDLGASLGAVTCAVRRALGERAAHVTAIDNSSAMVARCRELVLATPGRSSVDVVVGDALDFRPERASLVVSNFTLQFVPQRARDEIVERIFAGLLPGGHFVLSEKTHADGAEQEAEFTRIHDAFRRHNGYSQLELSNKRRALETVLETETPAALEDRLRRTGFEVMKWFSSLGFVSLLARKPGA